MPTKTSDEVEQKVLAARAEHRDGPDVLAAKVGVPARTVSRILRRHEVPYLRECDPITGDVIRSSKQTAVRYERERPGELVHMDVKKLGRIPDGGGWRANGRDRREETYQRKDPIGYDYVHSLVDDHSRLAYSEILPDETGKTCAAFLERAAAYFATKGITKIERVITDNALAYRKSADIKRVCAELGAKQKFIRPHCPWQNGKVERLNRTLATEWAYRQVFTSNPERAAALAPGSSTTTLNAATAHSEANHRSADCYQPDGRVHLARRLATGATTRARVVRLAAPGARTDVWPSDTAEASAPTKRNRGLVVGRGCSDVVVENEKTP